jgi:hypothetical protein
VEGKALDFHEEVDGVACQASFWPAPIRVLYDETAANGDFEVVRRAFDELEAPLF